MAIDCSGPRGRASRPRAAGAPAGPVILLILLASAGRCLAGQGDDSSAPTLERLDRSVALVRPDRGEDGDHRRRWLTWCIEYRLRNSGPEPLLVDAGTIFGTVEGWVSNSRAEGHGLPRRADHALSAGDLLESTAVLIDDAEPTRSCQERATLEVWSECEPNPPKLAPGDSSTLPEVPFRLDPGAVLRVRLRLEHLHHLHGPIEPLMGVREVTLRVGPASFRDAVTLDQSASVDRPIDRLGPMPDDRLDIRFYFSPPDSLYFDAALPGFRSFQYRDLKVPRDASMRLRFRYYRSIDSTGEARFELKQYQDVPNAYRVLNDAKRVETLDRLGEWVLVDHRIRSDPQATTMQLKFILDCEGEGPSALWIDDVTLEPSSGSSDPD